MTQGSIPDDLNRPICFFQGYTALFNCPEKGEIDLPAGFQLCCDEAAEPVEFTHCARLNKFPVQQALINPIPALKLPQGYATVIGENGSELSGGKRQRISIARALLKDAPIILLDEATASLDVENETKVQGALSRLLQGKTVLVIAHRMRTVEAADKIVVLSDGKVAEEGSPAELLEKENGIFRRMTRLQAVNAGWTITKE